TPGEDNSLCTVSRPSCVAVAIARTLMPASRIELTISSRSSRGGRKYRLPNSRCTYSSQLEYPNAFHANPLYADLISSKTPSRPARILSVSTRSTDDEYCRPFDIVA